MKYFLVGDDRKKLIIQKPPFVTYSFMRLFNGGLKVIITVTFIVFITFFFRNEFKELNFYFIKQISYIINIIILLSVGS